MSSSKTETEKGDTPKKGRLLVKKTLFCAKIRLHKKDTKFINQLYDALSDLGIDVIQKRDEFGLTGWVTVPTHILDVLRSEFSIKNIENKRLDLLRR